MIAQPRKARSKNAQGGTSRATATTTASALQATSRKTRSPQTREHICSPSWRNVAKQQRRAFDSWSLTASIQQWNLLTSAFRSHLSSNSNQARALPPTKEAFHTCCLDQKNQPLASATTTSISARHYTSIRRNQPSALATTTSIRTRHSKSMACPDNIEVKNSQDSSIASKSKKRQKA